MTVPSAEIPAELKCIPRRPPNSHKGDFGRILVVAGSVGMHGAAGLAAAAALESGAGLVTLAIPRSLYPILGPAELRATYLLLPETPGGALHHTAAGPVLAAARSADVVAMGPGLGTDPETVACVREVVSRLDRTLVLDADGLNAFPGEPSMISASRPAPVVTPQPGELARLTGTPAPTDDEARRLAAVDLALRTGGVAILKGHRSVITDGLEVYLNGSGNPGMATGGAGDVLTGCVAALLATVTHPLMAARIAAFAHGRAGDVAAACKGEIGTTATDMLAALAPVLGEFVAAKPNADGREFS